MIIHSEKNQYPILWLSSLAILLLVVSSFLSQKLIFLLFPVALVLLAGVFYRPQMIPVLLMLSFFIGKPLREYSMISIKSADVMFFLLVLGIFANRNKDQREFKLTESTEKAIYILIFFFLTCVLSILSNLNSKESLDIATSFWYLFNFVEVIVVILIFSQKRLHYIKETIITTFLVVSFFEQIMGFLQYLKLGDASLDDMRAVQGTFVHHAMLGNMMTIALALFLYRLRTSTSLKFKIIYLFGILSSLYIIIISGSRSGLVGIISASILITIFQFKISKKYLVYIGIFLLAGFLIFKFTPLHEIFQSTLKNEHTRTIDVSSYGRLLIWKGALLHFANADILHKLFGIGLGNYYTIIYPFIILSSSKHASGAHNNFLHVLTETGLLGLIFFIIFFTIVIIQLIKDSKHDKLSFSLLFSTIALLFSGFTQETFWFQPSFGALWVCYSVFIGFVFSDANNIEYDQKDEIKILKSTCQ